jgi:Icc-related predicted phosphoesterase
MIRVAAVADIHCGLHGLRLLGDGFARVADEADMLLLAGDLTEMGTVAEIEVLASALAGVCDKLPVCAILGNHDYEADAVAEIVAILGEAGVTVLEGNGCVLSVGGTKVGVVGTKGFGGGFAGACGTAFGEPEMKAFMATTHGVAAKIDMGIRQVRAQGAEVVVVMTHYSPCRDTLAGEKPEIFPFLGSYLMAEPMDRHGVDLAVHGHAHAGCEFGLTPGGVPVRNVAQAVLGRPYAVYRVAKRSGELPAHAGVPGTRGLMPQHVQH